MRLVAGGVAGMLHIDGSIGIALRHLARHVAVLLLGIDIVDESLLGLEVEGDGIILVGVASHLEDRGTELHAEAVETARGMHQTAVETHVDLVALQIHVFIRHVGVAKEIGNARPCLIHQRVAGRIADGGINAILALAVHAVQGKGVVDGFVMMVDSQLEGVHPGGIGTGILLFGGELERVFISVKRIDGEEGIGSETTARQRFGLKTVALLRTWCGVGLQGIKALCVLLFG